VRTRLGKQVRGTGAKATSSTNEQMYHNVHRIALGNGGSVENHHLSLRFNDFKAGTVVSKAHTFYDLGLPATDAIKCS